VWLGRQWRRLREWFGRQPWPRRVLIVAVVFTSPYWSWLGGAWLNELHTWYFVYTPEDRDFYRNGHWGYEEGLPSAGRRLKAEMESIPDPDMAQRFHTDWAVRKFSNGEWVFGYGINSHGSRPWRGTLVVKDSRGQVRIFFGHVCGTNGVAPLMSQGRVQSLDDFYRELREDATLREWVPDR
jgi:hypothetical protein